MNTINFKGVSSTTIDGLLICDLPPISKPPMRTKETMIDGRHGSIIEDLGYSSYDKTLRIGLHGEFDINKVIKFFSGEGDIIFGNEPDKVYHGHVVGQVDYTRLLRFKEAFVTFRVQPFKHKYLEAFTETQTASASSTNIVLKDSGATPMKISTDADKVIVHGKNIVNANGFEIGTNTSVDVFENGYKIIIVGGASSSYASSHFSLPLSMRGKSYVLKCDNIISNQTGTFAGAQVIVTTPSGKQYYALTTAKKSISFAVSNDAYLLEIGIYSNNTNAKLSTDNVVTLEGLCIVPLEFGTDAWCKYQGLQTISVVDGIAEATGYEPCTVISNADNVAMSVDYFKHFEVFNEGLETSKPKMIVNGSGTVELKVNGMAVFTYTFPEGENEVVIDSEIEEAYLGAILKNRNMLGEFPELVAKTNKIEWSGDVTSISILPRSRWL